VKDWNNIEFTKIYPQAYNAATVRTIKSAVFPLAIHPNFITLAERGTSSPCKSSLRGDQVSNILKRSHGTEASIFQQPSQMYCKKTRPVTMLGIKSFHRNRG
jgi:hypothetical protein